MYFWERKNGIRDSDEKSVGCGILVKKKGQCGIRTPLPDPEYCLQNYLKWWKRDNSTDILSQIIAQDYQTLGNVQSSLYAR